MAPLKSCKDPNYEKIKADERKQAAQLLQDLLHRTSPGPSNSPSVAPNKRKPESTPKAKSAKKGKTNSTACTRRQ